MELRRVRGSGSGMAVGGWRIEAPGAGGVLRGSGSLALWGGVFGVRLETAGIVPSS